MNNIERGRHLSDLLTDLQRLRVIDTTSPEAVAIWDRILSVGTILRSLADQPGLQLRLADKYGFDLAGNTFVFRGRELARAEAIRYRNLIAADGLVSFRVAYGQNGFINSVDDGFDLLADMRNRWGTVWNVWRSPLEIYKFTARSDQPAIPKDIAERLSAQLRTLYPMAVCQVYYGVNRDQVVK